MMLLTTKMLIKLSNFAAMASQHGQVAIWPGGEVTFARSSERTIPVLVIRKPATPREIRELLQVSSFVEIAM